MKAKAWAAVTFAIAGLGVAEALAHGDVTPQPVDTTGLESGRQGLAQDQSLSRQSRWR